MLHRFVRNRENLIPVGSVCNSAFARKSAIGKPRNGPLEIIVADIGEKNLRAVFGETVDLAPYASKITCPTLVVHGGLDVITPQDNADLLLKDLKCEVETMIWPDSVHCCHDRSHIVRPGMADFLLRKL